MREAELTNDLPIDRTEPPCNTCDPRVVAVCEESGAECKRFRLYVGK